MHANLLSNLPTQLNDVEKFLGREKYTYLLFSYTTAVWLTDNKIDLESVLLRYIYCSCCCSHLHLQNFSSHSEAFAVAVPF